MVDTGLANPRAWLEPIADGHHVHPTAMKLCYCCARDRLVPITDAMQAVGMPDGCYTFCGEEVEMHSGIAHTASGGSTGSTPSVDAAVHNMVKLIGIMTEGTIHMASPHSARLLGTDRQLGSLTVGKHADAITFNSGLHLQQIWIRGQTPPLWPLILSHVGLRSSITRPFFSFRLSKYLTILQ